MATVATIPADSIGPVPASRGAFWPRPAQGLTEAQQEELHEAAAEATRQLIKEGLTPETLMHLRQQVEADLRGELAAFHAATENRHKPACMVGCNHCCKITIPAAPWEIFAIMHYFSTHYDAEALRALRQRSYERTQHLKQFTPANRQQAIALCSLNNPADQSCMVFAVNPIACAKYTSFDAGRCKRSMVLGQSLGITGLDRQYEAYTAIDRGIESALEEAGFSCESVEIINAFHGWLEDPEGAWQRWFSDRVEPFPDALWTKAGSLRSDGQSQAEYEQEQEEAAGDEQA